MKYLANGQEAEVIQELSDGFLVRPILTDGYEDYPGNPEIVYQLFDNPPTAKVAAKVAALTEELARKQVELNRVIDDLEAATRRRTELIASLSQVPTLQYVDDFIAGKITHYVFTSAYGDLEILPIEKTKERDGFKLLTLFGSSDGCLSWRLNQYVDGSGSSRAVIPARSEEEAREKAEEWVLRSIRDGQYEHWDTVIAARKLGIELPAEYVEKARQNKLKRILENVDYRRKELANAETELAAMMTK